MAKTILTRLEVDDPGVAVFQITGKLGFHENLKIQRLTKECHKRKFRSVIFDFSGLSSLGGGVARILREFVKNYSNEDRKVHFIVTNEIVLQFLQDEEQPVTIHASLDEILSKIGASVRTAPPGGCGPDDAAGSGGGTGERKRGDREVENDDVYAIDEAFVETVESVGSKEFIRSAAPDGDKPVAKKTESEHVDTSGIILMSFDGELSNGEDDTADCTEIEGNNGRQEADELKETGETADENAGEPSGETVGETADENILNEIYGGKAAPPPPEWIDKPTSPFKAGRKQESADDDVEKLNKQLKRRILELKTLFSISTDFNAIRDRKKLLEIFLLTSIAQGGVESAAYFEHIGDAFQLVMSKGLKTDGIERLAITMEKENGVIDASNVIPIDSFPMKNEEREPLHDKGLEFICPFKQNDELAGVVLLGRRIAGRGMKEQDFEFLKILVNVAQNAYENATLFEHENERTLGIVKTLISLIEENTLIKGTSEFVSRYVGMVAKNMGYPDEYFKDLIYGTVLRDIGMIKISELILRSPRELTKDEWEIIKRHPEDGSDMLKRMKFSEHVIQIVRTHHERFNGEGYPFALRGKDLPLGSRIISVVESYAAMINERPNRPTLSEKEALDTLKENYSMRYDREVVMQFSKIIEKEIARSVQPGSVKVTS